MIERESLPYAWELTTHERLFYAWGLTTREGLPHLRAATPDGFYLFPIIIMLVDAVTGVDVGAES